jgi:hypothetical protein
MDFKPAPNSYRSTSPPAPASVPVQGPNPTLTPPPPVAPTQDKGDTKMVKRPKKLVLWLTIAILFIAALGTAAYYVKRYHDSQQQVKKLSSNPAITAQQEQAQLIQRVGKLTVLPTGETPTLATVTDITKLKDQAFFVNAQNGDKVLIYTQAKKAYLYRPSTNKLVNIAPVNIGDQTSTTGSTSTVTPTTPAKKP